MSRALLALLVLTAAATAEAAPPPGGVRVTATALAPERGGWTEVLLAARGGDVPWRGSVALASQSAKVHVALAVPARGQRLITVPLWLDRGGEARVWVDGAAAGRVAGHGDPAERVLVADGATVLPSIWRAYEAFDLVVLTPGATARLGQVEAAALDTWVRWGGAVAATRPGATEARALGAGTTLVAPSAADARAAFERLRRARAHADDPALALLRRWERARPPARPQDATGRPGTALGVLLGAYAALLGGVAVVAARRPTAGRAGVHLVGLVIAAGAVGTWSLARAGGPRDLDVHETALLVARPDAQAAHVSSVLRMRAHRSTTTGWTARAAMLVEVEPRRAAPRPLRAIRWRAEAGAWEREWVVGETAVVRAAGEWPDPGIRVRARRDGRAWRVENDGPHTLRSVVLVPADGPPRALRDLGPATSVEVDARATAPGDGALPEIAWALPLLGGEVETRPLLLATLARPIRSLDFLDGAVGVTGDTHVVVPLPRAPERRP
ncbi:MAG: hypothetical protein A3F92_14020 [Candidatus Rokubacteria bacterium RIFCSPLOWO2_12_FULL_71_22]|nr:MAG: hypothetical protein A3F92_14020 [Candidatus Rokubacteria bacterium RIFCSPLOWO2_12_FULL_71_22]